MEKKLNKLPVIIYYCGTLVKSKFPCKNNNGALTRTLNIGLKPSLLRQFQTPAGSKLNFLFNSHSLSHGVFSVT